MDSRPAELHGELILGKRYTCSFLCKKGSSCVIVKDDFAHALRRNIHLSYIQGEKDVTVEFRFMDLQEGKQETRIIRPTGDAGSLILFFGGRNEWTIVVNFMTWIIVPLRDITTGMNRDVQINFTTTAQELLAKERGGDSQLWEVWILPENMQLALTDKVSGYADELGTGSYIEFRRNRMMP